MTDEDKLLDLWESRQVERVALRFGRALDTGDWAAYRACFTEVLNVDFARLTGCAEVRVNADLWTRFAKQILTPLRRHHVYTNTVVAIDGDRAHAHIYMTARHWKATDHGSSLNTQYGWYDFWFERSPCGWLINRLKHDFQWVEGNGGLLDMTDQGLVATMGQVFCPENVAAAVMALQ